MQVIKIQDMKLILLLPLKIINNKTCNPLVLTLLGKKNGNDS